MIETRKARIGHWLQKKYNALIYCNLSQQKEISDLIVSAAMHYGIKRYQIIFDPHKTHKSSTICLFDKKEELPVKILDRFHCVCHFPAEDKVVYLPEVEIEKTGSLNEKSVLTVMHDWRDDMTSDKRLTDERLRLATHVFMTGGDLRDVLPVATDSLLRLLEDNGLHVHRFYRVV